MTRKSKKEIQNQSQSGRSMVEMLGVLAIIAILSIGGIVGYKLAMNYYQADQIANEINLMRNDLKVKYALGNEELLLGDPYDDTPADENYSGHLSTQYDRYPVDYDCIRKDKAEFYNCREADAYYIKVGNVSKGVCKPLTTLVNAMDGLMYIEINKQPYKEDDLCTSDEANEFYIQFDAEEVNGNYDSNRPEGWCGDDDDCDAPRSVCDVANHECVECIDHTDCPTNKPICNIDLGSCESCPSETPKWNGNTCVECLSPADCKNPEKQLCDTTTNTCIECLNNAQCVEKGKDPHCHKATHTCDPCPDGSHNNGSACVLSIDTIPSFYTENLGTTRFCKKLTPNQFGPYTHSYELWVKGTFDDYVYLFINQEEIPDELQGDSCLNFISEKKYVSGAHCGDKGTEGCSVFLPDYHLGTLNEGDFAHLLLYNVTTWTAWGATGRFQEIRDDAAAWLVLGDE